MRLLVAVAGGEGWSPNQVVEVDDEVADAWCDGVRAERVDDDTQVHEPAAEADLSRVSIDELWAELEARGAVTTETGIDDVPYRVEAITLTIEGDDVPDDDKNPEPPKGEQATATPKRRGRPPKGEQATATPGGEQR